MTLGSQMLARDLFYLRGTFLELILSYTSKICNLVCGTRLFPFISLKHWSSTRLCRTFQYFQVKQIWKWIFLACKELFQVAACKRWSRDHELMMPVWKFWNLKGIYCEHNLFHTLKMWGKVETNVLFQEYSQIPLKKFHFRVLSKWPTDTSCEKHRQLADVCKLLNVIKFQQKKLKKSKNMGES